MLGTKRGSAFRPNGRSADFIAPGTSNGCAMACACCCVTRRKGHSNPVTVFVNIKQVCAAIRHPAGAQGPKVEPNQVDPAAWVYDLGETGDLSVDAGISDNVRNLVVAFRTLPHAKGSFATKWVSPGLLAYDPQGRTRVRTALVAERIGFVNDLAAAGYETHLNFSPVVVREGFEAPWEELFSELDDRLSAQAKAQLACEVIVPTHNAALHEANLAWHPAAEALLWRPDLHKAKHIESGQANLRCRAGWKGQWLGRLLKRLWARMPYCRVRYAF